jgi:uncharacterized membrane protein
LGPRRHETQAGQANYQAQDEDKAQTSAIEERHFEHSDSSSLLQSQSMYNAFAACQKLLLIHRKPDRGEKIGHLYLLFNRCDDTTAMVKNQ